MKFIVKNIVLAAFCLGVSLLSTGCVGMINRSAFTDSTTFQQITAKEPLPTDRARVWVYVVSGGPNVANTEGRSDFISFNQEPYRIMGESFFHLDLQPGEYRVTTTELFRRFTGSFSELVAIRRKGPIDQEDMPMGPGKIRKQIIIEQGKEYFIRVQSPANLSMLNKSPTKNDWPFDLVTADTAKSEMTPLKHSTYYRPEQQSVLLGSGTWGPKTGPLRRFGKWVEDLQ